MEYIIITLCALNALLICAVLYLAAALRRDLGSELRLNRQELTSNVQGSLRVFADTLASSQKTSSELLDKRLAEVGGQFTNRTDALRVTLDTQLAGFDTRQGQLISQTEAKLEAIRHTLDTRFTALREDNSRHQEAMRTTVDEKLQKTLEDRIGKSFQLVSERLEQVYKGLGEMQTLAGGVGDLKKILSNVKTRGILGEIQLGAILEQILSPDQYERDVATRPNSREAVEFAVRLPGDGSGAVLLPIDAKFPGDTYAALIEAYENGGDVKAAQTALVQVLKSSAKMIRDKYVEPPYTTDFAIMFLPFEGLYAEAVRLGLVEVLQRDYKINISGPTTLAALLNSLQMGFRTLAIQKRSGEVWQVLSAVKTEFGKFGDVLEATQRKLTSTSDELEKLIGTRTRMINSKLRSVSTLPEEETQSLLSDEAEGF